MSVLIFKIGIDVNVYANVYRAPYVTKNDYLRDNPRFFREPSSTCCIGDWLPCLCNNCIPLFMELV